RMSHKLGSRTRAASGGALHARPSAVGSRRAPRFHVKFVDADSSLREALDTLPVSQDWLLFFAEGNTFELLQSRRRQLSAQDFVHSLVIARCESRFFVAVHRNTAHVAVAVTQGDINLDVALVGVSLGDLDRAFGTTPIQPRKLQERSEGGVLLSQSFRQRGFTAAYQSGSSEHSPAGLRSDRLTPRVATRYTCPGFSFSSAAAGAFTRG